MIQIITEGTRPILLSLLCQKWHHSHLGLVSHQGYHLPSPLASISRLRVHNNLRMHPTTDILHLDLLPAQVYSNLYRGRHLHPDQYCLRLPE
jgi:hypothetical protein